MRLALNVSRSDRRGAAELVMVVAVLLQVLGAILLKTLADSREDLSGALLVAGIGAVVVLNVIRLGVWGFAHSRFPLSRTFPVSALFFPAMLGVAAMYGDEIGARQVAGAVLISAGALWLSLSRDA